MYVKRDIVLVKLYSVIYRETHSSADELILSSKGGHLIPTDLCYQFYTDYNIRVILFPSPHDNVSTTHVRLSLRYVCLATRNRTMKPEREIFCILGSFASSSVWHSLPHRIRKYYFYKSTELCI